MVAPRFSDGFIAELKNRIRASDVIGRKVKLTKKGKEWVGLSPFTAEKTPSFYVNDQKQFFKCFSSGKFGDVISFLQETERLSFAEAIERLAEEAGMELPQDTPQARAERSRRGRLLDACEAACQYFEKALRGPEGAEARAYLERRGLPPESWERHRIGFAPDDWRAMQAVLLKQDVSMGDLLDAGLVIKPDGGKEPYDRFRGRVIFPIEDVSGHVIAFGGRALEKDAKPKYLNSPETELFHKGRELYRYRRAREAAAMNNREGLIVCEGYMDAIALTEAGFGYAVAPLGTALTEDQLGLLWKVGGEPILCFDGDDAGLRAAHKAIDRALPHLQPGRSLFFALLPDGLDPDDLIRERGKSAMGEVLEKSRPLVELLWQREFEKGPIDTPERRAGLEKRLEDAANLIQDDAVQRLYRRELRRLSNEYYYSGSKRPQQKRHSLDGVPDLKGLGILCRTAEHDENGASLETIMAVDFESQVINDIRDLIVDLMSSDHGYSVVQLYESFTGLKYPGEITRDIRDVILSREIEGHTAEINWQDALNAMLGFKGMRADEAEIRSEDVSRASAEDLMRQARDRHILKAAYRRIYHEILAQEASLAGRSGLRDAIAEGGRIADQADQRRHRRA